MSAPPSNIAHDFAEAEQNAVPKETAASTQPGSISEDQQDLEKQEPVDDKETYVHGLKLVFVFIGLSLSVFVIILDQTVSSALSSADDRF